MISDKLVATRSGVEHDQISSLIVNNLSIGDLLRLKVISDSMKPLIQIGDIVLVMVQTPDQIRQGDIVLIRYPKVFLTHRAVCPTSDGWVTKGDNLGLADPTTSDSDILGSVVKIERVDKIFDLHNPKWRRINTIIAYFSRIEVRANSTNRILGKLARLPSKIIRGLLAISFS